MISKNIPADIESKSIKETKEEINKILEKIEKDDANLQQLPYELLIVNVSTIGIHFLTGLLLTIGVLLGVWI